MKTKIYLTLIGVFVTLFFMKGEILPASSTPAKEDPVISRTIDAAKTFRTFPDLAGYWNTSIQKAPAPAVAELAERTLGKAKITRTWLNLDEMWDYRSRKYDYDFKIGVDKYKSVDDKFRESWDWQVESPSKFYEYMDAFSQSSEELMLTIRRYERDVLDKKLPISKQDWKDIFKEGLKHYKQRYPNIRYIEVGNEYGGKSFMDGTAEEYYLFYQLGSEAVAEINEELKLKGKNRLLVGGPVVTGNILDKIDKFLRLYAEDQTKRPLDFIAWHDYHKDIETSYGRESQIKDLLIKYGLPDDLLLFMTEHDPYHYSDDKPEYHYQNAAYLPKSLYFTSLESPAVKIFPWVLYHNSEIQTKFMWFSGSNEVEVKLDELRILPLGYSMKFLSMLKGEEIEVNNIVDSKDLVIATRGENRFSAQVINYSQTRPIELTFENIKDVFPNHKSKKLILRKFILDKNNNNTLEEGGRIGDLQPAEEVRIDLSDKLILKHNELGENSIVLWELVE